MLFSTGATASRRHAASAPWTASNAATATTAASAPCTTSNAATTTAVLTDRWVSERDRPRSRSRRRRGGPRGKAGSGAKWRRDMAWDIAGALFRKYSSGNTLMGKTLKGFRQALQALFRSLQEQALVELEAPSYGPGHAEPAGALSSREVNYSQDVASGMLPMTQIEDYEEVFSAWAVQEMRRQGWQLGEPLGQAQYGEAPRLATPLEQTRPKYFRGGVGFSGAAAASSSSSSGGAVFVASTGDRVAPTTLVAASAVPRAFAVAASAVPRAFDVAASAMPRAPAVAASAVPRAPAVAASAVPRAPAVAASAVPRAPAAAVKLPEGTLRGGVSPGCPLSYTWPPPSDSHMDLDRAHAWGKKGRAFLFASGFWCDAADEVESSVDYLATFFSPSSHQVVSQAFLRGPAGWRLV